MAKTFKVKENQGVKYDKANVQVEIHTELIHTDMYVRTSTQIEAEIAHQQAKIVACEETITRLQSDLIEITKIANVFELSEPELEAVEK